ncbi:putative pentatricopeptide repeat-containing protein At1g16830 isoform X2 [Cornus florida]|uniref:putative pentatricopeptide repeat-containing protein At1g16830 isoform X2 n=1 Tax=Cornus florida TaxID=4283 RepID=UPI00289BBAFE|nr:putative pentatricopeptide repeat-containing protein At1g16830 isoform X2 [Cornus florida]
MICRWKWKLLHTTSYRIIQTPYFLAPIRSISSAIECFDKAQKCSTAEHCQKLPRNSKTLLTSQIVQSTLLNCPSDLITLSFFLWCARQPNYFHDNCAFDHLVNVVARLAQQFTTVKIVINQLESIGCVTKPQTFLLLIRIYWQGGLYDLVFEAFEEMIKYGYTPNTFARNIVMDVLFKIGRVDEALGVLKENQFPNFLTFRIAICNLCRLNDLSNVQGLLRNMLRKGYRPDGKTFLTVLNCYCKLGRLVEALQVLSLMITFGISTSVTTWSILIDGFCKCGRLGAAGYLLDKMVETGCSPNVVTYTPLVKGFMQSKMASSAFSILSRMESKGCSLDLVLCNVLIDCLSKLGQYDDALDVFFSLSKRNLIPDSYTLCSIMSAICLSKQFDLLPILVSGPAIQSDLAVCNSLLSYFCKAGYPSGAVEFYNDIIDRGFIPDMYTFAGLLTGLCGAGRVSEAVNVYHGILINHFGQDAQIHTVIVNGLIKAGQFQKAIRLFRKAMVKKYPLDVVSYTVAIHGLLRGGRAGEACTLYNEMKEVGVAPNKHTYHVLLSGLCRERNVKMVKQIIQEIIDEGIELDCNTSNMINNLLFKSHYSCSGLLHKNAMPHGVNAASVG